MEQNQKRKKKETFKNNSIHWHKEIKVISESVWCPSAILFLTVLDLSKLPELSIISETAEVDKNIGWNNNFKANWPNDGKLLWTNKGGYLYWGWVEIDDIGMNDIWWLM